MLVQLMFLFGSAGKLDLAHKAYLHLKATDRLGMRRFALISP